MNLSNQAFGEAVTSYDAATGQLLPYTPYETNYSGGCGPQNSSALKGRQMEICVLKRGFCALGRLSERSWGGVARRGHLLEADCQRTEAAGCG